MCIKEVYLTLLGWLICVCSYGKFSSHLGEIPGKSSETHLGALAHFSYECTTFF